MMNPISNNQTQHTKNQWRKVIAIAGCVFSLAMILVGCGDADESGEPKVTADNFQLVYDTKGTPIAGAEQFIGVNERIRGANLSANRVQSLKYTSGDVKTLVSGRQTFTGKGAYVKSKKLRITEYFRPEGSRVVQVVVSLGSPFALKRPESAQSGAFEPAPVLQDNIHNSYWPFGFTYESKMSGDSSIVIDLQPATQFKELVSLPRLSRNKPAVLTLLYYVNEGVTIESFSYGGYAPKYTFSIEVPKGR